MRQRLSILSDLSYTIRRTRPLNPSHHPSQQQFLLLKVKVASITSVPLVSLEPASRARRKAPVLPRADSKGGLGRTAHEHVARWRLMQQRRDLCSDEVLVILHLAGFKIVASSESGYKAEGVLRGACVLLLACHMMKESVMTDDLQC